MYITKLIETETGHRLTDYSGKCAHIHGHRLQWEVTVAAPALDSTGFVMDYSDLKAILKETVDQLDHAFIMHNKDPIHIKLGSDQTETREFLKATNGDVPRLFITPFNPTSENIIPWIAEMIIPRLPKGINLVKIKMWETSSSYTEWIAPRNKK